MSEPHMICGPEKDTGDPHCLLCYGRGRLHEQTSTPSDDGGENWREVPCWACDLRAEINRLITQREVWLEKLRTVTAERDEATEALAVFLKSVSTPDECVQRAESERDGYRDSATAAHEALSQALRDRDEAEQWKHDCKQAQAEIERLTAQVADYETRLSTEMPLDYKDWWQNSRSEWPEVATAVLRMRRLEIERLTAELDDEVAEAADEIERLTAALDDEDDIADRLGETLAARTLLLARCAALPLSPLAALTDPTLARDIEQAIGPCGTTT